MIGLNRNDLGYMKIIAQTISLGELKQLAAATFGNLLKAVVDVDRELIGDKFWGHNT